MNYQSMQDVAHLCIFLAIIVPFYLVTLRSKFWPAVLASWFYLVAEHVLSSYVYILIHWPPGARLDKSAIRDTVFYGGILSLLYCGILVMIRKLARRGEIPTKNLGESRHINP